MILVLNFDKNPLYSSCDGIVNCEIDLYQEIIYEVGYSLSDLSYENVEDKSQLILGLLGKENDVFEAINSQITQIINTLVSENPTGTYEIVFPSRYIDWLRYNVNPAYRSIADALAKSNGKLEMSIDELYEQTISDNVVRKAKDTINHHPDIDCIVVSGVDESDKSRFIKDITDNNPSIQVVDDSYKPLLGLLASKYLKLRDYEIVASLFKKIDTFDSWVGLVAHKMIEEADDIKDCIQQVKSKATNTREEKIISEIAKAWDIKSDNNLPSFGITLMQWIKYVSDENNPVNLPYYIAESRLDNIEEEIIWYKNSGDEGIIKAAYIYIGNVENMIEQLNHEYSDSLYLDIRKICKTVNDMVYDFVHNSANHSVNPTDLCLIVSQKILGDVQSDIVAVKYKGIDKFINYLSEIYNEVNDWLNKTGTSISGAKAWIENLLYFGGEKDVVERLEQRIAEAKIEFERISDDYKAKREEEENRIKQEKAEKEARINRLRINIEGEYNMVFVPGGRFLMGKDSADPLAHEHYVDLSPFMVMDNTVTGQLYSTVMETTREYGIKEASWSEIQDFLLQMNSITGESFSIISEAQYEWIYRHDSGFNLYEEEYCADDYNAYPYTDQTDPIITTDTLGYADKVARDSMSRIECRPDWSKAFRLVRKATQKDIEEYEKAERLRKEEEEAKRKKNDQLDAQYLEAYKKLSEYEAFLDANQGSSYNYVEDVEQINRVMPYLTFLHDNGRVRFSIKTDDEQYAGIMAYLKICHYDKIPLDWHEDIFNLLHIYSPKYIHRVYTEAKIIFAYCEVFGIHCPIDNQSALDSFLESSLKKTIPSLTDRQEIKKQKDKFLYGNDQKQLDDRRIKYMQNVGSRFLTGDKEAGIPHNPRFAFVLLEKAAQEGDKEAIKLLSKCYREGIGTKKDEIKADELYKEEEIRKTETSEINNTSSKVGFFGRLFGKKK